MELISVFLEVTTVLLFTFFIMRLSDRIKALNDHQIELGKYINIATQYKDISEQFFINQARIIQGFLERFLGYKFNIQCTWMRMKTNDAPKFHLWIWKQYETRDMGVVIISADPAILLELFMRKYYTDAYLSEAEPFPNR